MHLERPSKLWNNAETGSLVVRRLWADTQKQRCRASPKISQQSRSRAEPTPDAGSHAPVPRLHASDGVRHRLSRSSRAALSAI